jgi:uncharacterized protein
MQQQFDQPFTEQDLERLDHFLAEVAPDDSMLSDELHGFLAALICSPQMVLPSEWTPHVWGGTEPEFETMDAAQEVMGQIMRLNNDVAGRLADGDFGPLFMEETLANGHTVLDPHGWCEGFVRGMQLQPDAWQDDDLNEFLMPIIVLSDTIKDDPKIDELLASDETIEELAEFVPGAVVSIFRHQRKHFQPPSQTVKRAGPKVGRNDPCPCGSGKKYKKCCGAQTLH